MTIHSIKPQLTYREAFPHMSNDLTNPGEAGVPGFLRKMSTGASFGNIDASDLKPPRLKVLAGQSPEVIDGVPGAQPGNFWLTDSQSKPGSTSHGFANFTSQDLSGLGSQDARV